jgi:hypothetical protein
MTPAFEPRVVWQPQEGPQQALIACPLFEVFFGGARGGGKTEGSIGDWLEHSATWGELASGLFVRRKFKQLEDVIRRTKQIFPKIGAKYNETRAEWAMPGGGVLRFRYLERDEDAEEYQGHSYTRVYVEEATNFPSPSPIDKLRATVRSGGGAPGGMRLTGNPGGPGHQWVKHRFIDPNPLGWQILTEEFDFTKYGIGKQSLQRIYIPSRVSDNKLLLKNDPTYLVRLQQSGSAALVAAWLDGDWSIIDGVYFNEWDPAIHVLDSSWLARIPRRATRFMAMDWGYAKPFSIGWYAVSDGTWGLPPNAILRYREFYGSTGKPNEGLRMGPRDIAERIISMEKEDEALDYRTCDPAMHIRDGGPSIAEEFAREQLYFRRGDNKRLPGWAQVRLRLKGDAFGPRLFVLDTCRDLIRTLPTIQHDDRNAEDLDTDAEDHAVDELRYACTSRPWVIGSLEIDMQAPHKNDPYKMTFNDMVAANAKNRRRAESFNA